MLLSRWSILRDGPYYTDLPYCGFVRCRCITGRTKHWPRCCVYWWWRPMVMRRGGAIVVVTAPLFRTLTVNMRHPAQEFVWSRFTWKKVCMPFYYFAHRERLRSIVMTMSLCLCVCLSARISGTTRAIFTKFLCLLPVSVAQSSSGMFTTGRITYRREGVFFPIENALSAGERGWECTARVKHAIYDCLVFFLCLNLQDRPTQYNTEHHIRHLFKQ